MGETVGTRVKETMVDVANHLGEGGPRRASNYAESIRGSTILQIAGEIRTMLAAGEEVLNLTIGDFRPDQFPIPAAMAEKIVEAIRAGETNYPPVTGLPELREAVRELLREDMGLDYPIESILVGGGARPLLYVSYMVTVDPGETVLYPVPSWNNHHYVNLAGGKGVPLPVTAEKNFHIDASDIAPYLSEARLLALNSPLNPTGTCISREQLGGICEAIAEENRRRASVGERPFYLLYDQVYNTLLFGGSEHFTPVELVPEMAPYTFMTDAVSKGLCGTGVRVGWMAGPPDLVKKMAAMCGHYGAWAPRAEQLGTARFLRERESLLAHRRLLIGEVEKRLGLLDEGLTEMKNAGLPVDHIEPQGAIYLSVRFGLKGQTIDGQRLESNEDIRSLLLRKAGFAVVPFEAFGLAGDDGWFRISVGAVSPDEIRTGLARVRELLERAS